MILANEAISAAKVFAYDIYKSEYNNIPHIELEEVELSDNNSSWLITLSIEEAENFSKRTMGIPLLSRQHIKYKSFNVDAETGIVTSMKIRTVGT